MLNRMFALALRIGLVLGLVLVMTHNAFAQSTSGAFRGTVTDPSGAAIVGAEVTARNEATGVAQQISTDENGGFFLGHLTPGVYTVSVTMQGFKVLSRPGLELLVDQQINLNLALTIGTSSETVTVTSSTPVLQTHSVETGQVIETKEILDLPLEGRDFKGLFLLTAGVTNGVGGNGDNISVNGQREFANSIVLDGIEVTGNRNNTSSITPSVDAMQEFKVVTSAYAAEFGRAAGGVVLLQTKPGTNDIHGSAYGFYRPSATAAKNYFSLAPPTVSHRNFGGTVGGPIIRDKTFFFVSYEGFRSIDGSTFQNSVPPSNQVKFLPNGDADLSGLIDPLNGGPIPIFDPQFYAENFYSQQFTGNIIPADRISPAGKAILLNFFPAAVVPATPDVINGYGSYLNSIYSFSQKTAFDKVDTRIDHNISASDRLSAEYHYSTGLSLVGDPFAGQISAIGGGGTDTGDNTTSRNHSVAIGETHLFSPRFVNEFRFGFNNFALSQLSLLDGQTTADQYGVGNVNLSGFPSTDGFPYIYLGTGYTTGGSSYKPLTFLDRNYQFVDTLSWTKGKHQFKFGGEFRKLTSHPEFSLFPTGYQYYAGAYSFYSGYQASGTPYAPFTSDYTLYDAVYPAGPDYTAAFPSGGSDLADLLLGLPQSVNIGLQLTNPVTKSWELHGFFQDEWQVSPHLSLFYGVRYEYQNPYYEASNNSSNYDPTTKTILLAGRGGNSSTLINADKNNFAPRIGFSYQLNNKTVLRGGYGVYYSPENDARSDVLTKNYPFNDQQVITNNIYDGFPTYQLDAGVPRSTTVNIPTGASSIDPSAIPSLIGQSVFYVDPNFRTGYSQLYNITLQREVVPNLSLEVGYVGSQGRALPYAVGNINVNNVLDPSVGTINAQYPEGNSGYNSLQVKVTKRYSNDLSVLLAYTYGKGIDNGPAPFNLGTNHDSPQDPTNLGAERAVSSNDITHNIVGSFLYGLPFGQKKMFLSHLNAVGQAILGGWQLNGIVSIRTGLPYNIVQNGNNVNFPGLRPDLLHSPTLHGSDRSVGLDGQYIDPTAFSTPAGSVPGDLGRNAFRGPGAFNLDASMLKDIAMTERLKLQLRFEFFNATNTPQFDNPNADFSQKATFGKVTGASSARVVQFGVKILF
ncbi:MAG TPA: TonB-dependent receptor [Candidatus Saccharimonadales bacterium]|nr:TonB-dependent receptor [Candidatus Saccharimonadales bacterium]